MEQGRSSPKAWATLDELRGTILGLNPPTGAQQVRYNQVLEQLHPWETPGESDCWPLMRGWPLSCGWCY